MALDPRIALAVQPTNISGAIQQGLEDRQARAMMPLELAAKQQQIDYMKAQQENAQAEADKTELLRQATGAKFTMEGLQQLQSLPQEQRMPAWQIMQAKLNAMKFDTSGIAPEDVTTDEGLKRSIATISPFIAATDQKLKAHSVGSPFQTVEDGKAYSNVQIYDEATGKSRIERVPIQGSITNQGLTPLEKQQMAIAEAQSKANIQNAAAISQLAQSIPLSGQKAGVEGGARTQSELEQKDIYNVLDSGRDSIKAKANLERALQLMEKVKTGGLNQYKNEIAQFLNMQGTANEGELASNLQKVVIENMALIKGNPTEKEGRRVEISGPNYGVSSETNISLLKQGIKAAEKNIKNANQVYSEAKKDNPKGYRSYAPWYESDINAEPQQSGDKSKSTVDAEPKTPKNVRDILKGR